MKNRIRRTPRITFDRAYLRLNPEPAPGLSALDLHLLNEELKRDLAVCREQNAFLHTELERSNIHAMWVINTILVELFPGLTGEEISKKAGEYSQKAFMRQQFHSAQNQINSLFGGTIE